MGITGYSISLAVSVNRLTNDKTQTAFVIDLILWLSVPDQVMAVRRVFHGAKMGRNQWFAIQKDQGSKIKVQGSGKCFWFLVSGSR